MNKPILQQNLLFDITESITEVGKMRNGKMIVFVSYSVFYLLKCVIYNYNLMC